MFTQETKTVAHYCFFSYRYVPEKITVADLAPMYRQFYRVFEIFKLENKPKPSEKDKATDSENSSSKKKTNEKDLDDDDDDIDEVRLVLHLLNYRYIFVLFLL